ncbi:DUF4294 domain-containing protein [Ginsengibacter hankyongi]|uniref:DUF4294 domain-containing protein n=1 Tax=Ginsengibacter hankyongi TaxID=2607284 RepID=A0A5J5IH04_9BACT|nr:DUF4294 domain-containing protein [Ginsengibacter hankyongi]KAA9038496.1 DUF4294 domain-containing protein [Ginsengibacter hankyongi]
MPIIRNYSAPVTFSLIIIILSPFNNIKAQSKYGQHDTIITSAVVYEGDTIPAQVLAGVYLWKGNLTARQRWTRLRNAVYVTYPYAKRAGIVFNDIEKHIAGNHDKLFISKYINSREKELKKEFTEPLTNLSVYQGKVLMKLINRETKGINCYDIVKELKGGLTARFWQTVAFFFGSDLKQPYDARGQDAEIESIVREVQKMYGYSG